MLLLLAATSNAAISAAEGITADVDRESDEINILLVICFPYGANINLMRDVMELYGWNVTTTALTPLTGPCYYGGPMTVDIPLTDITDLSPYDCVAIMQSKAWSGTSHAQLLSSPEALALVAQAVSENLLVAAHCGGTRVLAAADVINGVRVTGHGLYEDEYIAAGGIYVGNPSPPVLDGNILTVVRGQYYSYQFCDAVAAAIDSMRAASTNN